MPTERRIYRIDPDFQDRFRRHVLAFALALAGIALLFALGVRYVLSWAPLISSLAGPVLLVIAAVATGAGMLHLCDRFSNRCCGPIYRIIRILDAVRDGQPPQLITLREGDEFQDLARALNEVLPLIQIKADAADSPEL